MNGTVNTVLGPVDAAQLGVTSVHEALLSVVPGAQHAFDVTIDRAEVFAVLAEKLRAYRAAGGGAVVDSTGMFHGRDLRLYEALSRATGVHIVSSTGQGPEALLGGYFLTPQTNPPTPWPAERFAELFSAEVTEGAVVPRLERRAPAGIVTTASTRDARTGTDESLIIGAARTAAVTGIPVSIRFGADALADLDLALAEGLPADRVVIAGLDRADASIETALEVAARGARVGIDSVGLAVDGLRSDDERVALVTALIDAGHTGRILLSSGAIGVAKGHLDAEPAESIALASLLTDFVPLLESHGVASADIERILITNPGELLAVRS